jgi:PAS domain S-box-containing protein
MTADRMSIEEDTKRNFDRTFWRSTPAVDEILPDLTPAALTDDQFRLLADNIPTLCWVANGDGYIIWYNRRWHEYCGTSPVEMEGWGWQSVHDPEFLPNVLERWTRSIATGQPFEMTFPLRGADGVFRPFLTRVQPVRDRTGRVARWFGVNTEIGAQVDAEKALRIERDRSQGVLQHMAEGFALLDGDFRIVAMNPEGLRLDGRDASEIIGKTHWEAYPDAVELIFLFVSFTGYIGVDAKPRPPMRSRPARQVGGDHAAVGAQQRVIRHPRRGHPYAPLQKARRSFRAGGLIEPHCLRAFSLYAGADRLQRPVDAHPIIKACESGNGEQEEAGINEGEAEGEAAEQLHLLGRSE